MGSQVNLANTVSIVNSSNVTGFVAVIVVVIVNVVVVVTVVVVDDDVAVFSTAVVAIVLVVHIAFDPFFVNAVLISFI